MIKNSLICPAICKCSRNKQNMISCDYVQIARRPFKLMKKQTYKQNNYYYKCFKMENI